MDILAYIAAAFAAMVVGFIWYHPKTFGSAWMRGVGMTEEKMAAANPAITYGLALLMAGILAFFVAFVGGGHEETAIPKWRHFAFHGSQMGLIMILPIMVIISLFEQLDFKTIAINAGYWIVTLGVMGAVVGAVSDLL